LQCFSYQPELLQRAHEQDLLFRSAYFQHTESKLRTA
jgi:hypothetical protein